MSSEGAFGAGGSSAGQPTDNQENDTEEARVDGGGSVNEKSLPESIASSSQKASQLSPGFRSMAALAGWDDEALLLAALNHSPGASAEAQNDEREDPRDLPASPAYRDRKRDTRTPLSSARRHRKVRWQGRNGSPLVRVPMKALPLVSDNEKGNSAEEQEEKPQCTSGRKDKENINPQTTSAGLNSGESKGKLKEKTPTKPPYMDQLREELSCAVCLDICFEPSTISCGHSFCGTCLQSVLKMPGPKCPKCRQSLRGETLRSCRINTVLWNTIQILFPQECAARLADKQKQQQDQEEETANLANLASGLGIRPSRLQPWRSTSSAFPSSVNRISVMGTLRSSFQSASQFTGEDRELGLTGRAEEEVRQLSGAGRSGAQQDSGAQRSQSRSGRIRRARQEQVDASLAARLQQAELMMSPQEEVHTEEPSQAAPSRSWNHNRPRYNSRVSLAAANLRAVASRATRVRTRPQS